MARLAVLSTDKALNKKIQMCCHSLQADFTPIFLADKIKCLEYLNYELPEVCVFNLSDQKIGMPEILSTIKSDPWLHYGGIIGIHAAGLGNELEKSMKEYNVISLIDEGQFDFNFPRVIRIINQNRQILFQRDIQSHLLSSISGSFIIDNDPFDMKTYANLVANYLLNSNYIDREGRDQLLVSLMELLMNAIEHGNCKISYEEKSRWLDSGEEIFELIRQKNKDPMIKDKTVFFQFRITPEASTFSIRDQGDGFDWRSRVKKITEKNYLELHGRGIMMADHYVQDLRYNDSGNEVQFDIPYKENAGNLLPQAFSSDTEIVFENGDTVFTEGEESNFLYYIVSGNLQVIANGKVLSTLTPDDLFLGEMSFLLNNRRSATVRSEGQTVLLKISKESFVNVIKAKPHYGIFLARILAQRLQRLNKLF